MKPIGSLLFGVLCTTILILLFNTSITETGIQPYGTEVYRDVLSNEYYVRIDRYLLNPVVEDSVTGKLLDNVQNKYYIVREYNGFMGFYRSRIVNVIQ